MFDKTYENLLFLLCISSFAGERIIKKSCFLKVVEWRRLFIEKFTRAKWISLSEITSRFQNSKKNKRKKMYLNKGWLFLTNWDPKSIAWGCNSFCVVEVESYKTLNLKIKINQFKIWKFWTMQFPCNRISIDPFLTVSNCFNMIL